MPSEREGGGGVLLLTLDPCEAQNCHWLNRLKERNISKMAGFMKLCRQLFPTSNCFLTQVHYMHATFWMVCINSKWFNCTACYASCASLINGALQYLSVIEALHAASAVSIEKYAKDRPRKEKKKKATRNRCILFFFFHIKHFTFFSHHIKGYCLYTPGV